MTDLLSFRLVRLAGCRSVGQHLGELQLGKVVAICDHLGLLGGVELEHEIAGEAVGVALHREPGSTKTSCLCSVRSTAFINRGRLVSIEPVAATA